MPPPPPISVKSFISLSSIKRCHPLSTCSIPTSPHFLVDYLITSIGFSKAEALSASAKLTHLKSIQNPESVVNFLKQTGLDNTQIKTAVSIRPTLLSSSVDKTLKPKLRVFQDLGFSGQSLGDLLSTHRFLLTRGLTSTIIPCIEFLQSILGKKEHIIKVIKKTSWLISNNAPQRMKPNISLLQTCGVSNHRIGKLILDNPQCFVLKPERLQRIVDLVEGQFGISRDSWMFSYAVDVFSSLSKEKMEEKFRIFEKSGWSVQNVILMTRNLPFCLGLSEEKIVKGLDFFMKDLGYNADYIAAHPKLLMYSLEKRVVPRHKVLNAVKEKKLIKRNPSLYWIVCLPESRFLKEYVIEYKDEIPDVCQTYLQAVKPGFK